MTRQKGMCPGKKKKKKDKYLDHSKAQGRWISWDLCVPSSSFPLPPPFGSTGPPSLLLTLEPIPTASVSQQKRVMAIPATDPSPGLGCLRRECEGRKRREKHKAGDAASTRVLWGTRTNSNNQTSG